MHDDKIRTISGKEIMKYHKSSRILEERLPMIGTCIPILANYKLDIGKVGNGKDNSSCLVLKIKKLKLLILNF